MKDSIGVQPQTNLSAVKVITDNVDSIHYPIYKIATGNFGEVDLVGNDNPLAVMMLDFKTLMKELIIQMKINNAYHALGHDEVIKEEDVYED